MSERRLNVRISAETDQSLEIARARRRITRQDAVNESLAAWLSKESAEPLSDVPVASTPHASIAEIPAAVLDVIRRHIRDHRFRDSLSALGQIWDSADQGVIKAITSNCIEFVNGVTAKKRLHEIEHGINAAAEHEQASKHHRGRMDRLMASAKGSEPGTPPDTGEDEPPSGG